MPPLDPVPVAILRGTLALLLLQAARHKFADRPGFAAAVAAYGLLPAGTTRAAAAALPWFEGLAAALLLAPGGGRAGGLLAAALLALYGGAIAGALARGRRDIDCGCGGPARGVPVSGALLARNAVLAIAATACVAPVAARTTGWIDGLSTVAGVAAATALLAAIESLLATGTARARIEANA